MKTVTLCIVLVSAVISIFTFVTNVDWRSGGLFIFGMLLWMILPYFIVAFVSRMRRNLFGSILLLLASIVCVIATIIYIDGFYIDLDAQNGLLFIFIPIYQIFFVGLLCAATVIASSRLKAEQGAAANP